MCKYIQQIGYKEYFSPTVEIKNYNGMIDRRNFFDQPLKNNVRTYNIGKIATGQGKEMIIQLVVC